MDGRRTDGYLVMGPSIEHLTVLIIVSCTDGDYLYSARIKNDANAINANMLK